MQKRDTSSAASNMLTRSEVESLREDARQAWERFQQLRAEKAAQAAAKAKAESKG